MYNEMIKEDPRVIDVLSRNNVPRGASILNIKRDPRRTTDRYYESDDLGIIETFNKNGWSIVEYQEVKTRKPNYQGFQKYLATYEHPDIQVPDSLGGKPRILQKGSHDGTTALEMLAGFFRWACCNGVVVGDSLFEPIKIKHIGDPTLEVENTIEVFSKSMPSICDTISKMNAKELSTYEVDEFGRQATRLRFKDYQVVEVKDVTRPRRLEDQAPTLWNVFNRVQENFVKPYKGFKATSVNGKKRGIRTIKNIETKVRLNKDLWNLAEAFLVQ